jgi:hypothetical protein
MRKDPGQPKRKPSAPRLIHKNDHVIPRPIFCGKRENRVPHPSILQTEYTSTGIRLYVQERKEKVSVDKTQANRWYKERKQQKKKRERERDKGNEGL